MRSNSDSQARSKTRGTAGLFRRALLFAAILALSCLVLYVTGIGCPFRALTGIPCPGCGMTRAWLAAFGLDWRAALAYHPLFWMVPPMFALACARDYVTTSRTRKTIDAALVAICLLLVAVWAIRLVNPADAGLLFGAMFLWGFLPISFISSSHAGSSSFALTCRDGGYVGKAVDT